MWTLEVDFRQLNKHGEEIPGDRVDVQSDDRFKVVVMSDGLGSGIKANILASLTTRIIATMLREGCTIQEVAETLNDTLPVCNTRRVAYSTFTALKVYPSGLVESAEYDNPPLLWFSSGELVPIPRREVAYSEKMKVQESVFQLKENDWVVALSDGVVHAGLGKTWDFGWGWDRAAAFIRLALASVGNASELSGEIIRECDRHYGGVVGDDTTVVVLHRRKMHVLTMMIGPPKNPAEDSAVVEKLVSAPGRKVVCGGTTSNIVSRVMQCPVFVLTDSGTRNVPAMGEMEGVDLLTEGVFTIAEVVDMFRKNVPPKEVAHLKDGASLLFGEICRADHLDILMGQALNPAQQNPDTPVYLGLKFHLIGELRYLLEQKGKTVNVETF